MAKNIPNNRAAAFLDWFTYSDNSIDGQSKKRSPWEALPFLLKDQPSFASV